MKAKLIITLLILLFDNDISYGQGVNFSRPANWISLLEQAKVERKFIFLDAYATWCGPCKLMDQDVYPYKWVGDSMNTKFISIKVQTDKTDNDDEYVKSWYKDAEMLCMKYQISALPALMFFSPDGELVYRNFGYQNSMKFLETVKFAVGPDASGFNAQVDAYRKGERDYPNLPNLIGKMRELLVDDSLANVMVKDYFSNYVNKLSLKEEVLTKVNTGLAFDNPGIVKSSDNFFVELLKTPIAEAEKLMEWPGAYLALQRNIATKEELYLKLYKDKKPYDLKPDWPKIENAIKEKYPIIDAKKTVDVFGLAGSPFDNYQGYYYILQDWKRINELLEKSLKQQIARKDWAGANNICWWDYFCRVPDKTSLECALKGIENVLAGAKVDPKVDTGTLASYIDTKAALLYKLGHRGKAIKTEKGAIEIVKADNLKNGKKEYTGCGGFFKTIELMKRGEKIQSGYDLQIVYPKDWKLLD